MLKMQLNKDSTSIEIDRGGQKHCKNVDFGELMAAMQQHSVHDFGLLPSNTRHLAVSGNNYSIMVEVPPGLRNLTVDNRGKMEVVEKVPLPSALFVFSLLFRDGGFFFNNSWVYALEYDRLMLSTDKLFAYPTPNVHPDDRICWGHNDTKEKMKSLAGVEGYIRTFFAAAFNHDLFNTDRMDKVKFPWDMVKSQDGIYDISGYYKFLVSNGAFNKEWLRPIKGEGETFASLAKKMGR